MNTPASISLLNASILDVRSGQVLAPQTVEVNNGKIASIGAHPGTRPGGTLEAIDCKGMVLMPGLIDCHVHINAFTSNAGAVGRSSPAYVAARATAELRAMLLRGFTTVRDVGGADWGLALAVREGYVAGPELIYGGHIFTQTGGVDDYRELEDLHSYALNSSGLSIIVDGVQDMRVAVRNEIRRGAEHIKLVLSGGTTSGIGHGMASSSQGVRLAQYSDREIVTAVDEAGRAGIYVATHAYGAEAVERALRLGARTVEHGCFISQRTYELFLEKAAFYVPTLVTHRAHAEVQVQPGDEVSLRRAKVAGEMLDSGLVCLADADNAGVQIAFGTDLTGASRIDQLDEFKIRSQVQGALSIIRSATMVGAALLGREGQIGEVIEGAQADLIIVNGNPLEDIGVLTRPDRHLRLVMKAGAIHKNSLAPGGSDPL